MMEFRKALKKIECPKWAGMLVKGHPVTREQASEILIRTDNWYLHTNNTEFEIAVCERFNITDDLVKVEIFKTKLHILYLNLLSNQRICSSWVGGPHGWCDWEGNIFSDNYNLGKWPTAYNIYLDWLTITKAFPFLNLSCQIYDGEVGDNPQPILQYDIKEGRVEIRNSNFSDIGKVKELEENKYIYSEEDEIGIDLDSLTEKVNELLVKFNYPSILK